MRAIVPLPGPCCHHHANRRRGPRAWLADLRLCEDPGPGRTLRRPQWHGGLDALRRHQGTRAGDRRGTAYAVGKAFVVWGDFTRGAGGSGGSIGSQGAEGEGYMDSHDGRKVEFRYAIGDGKTGRVTLDGVDYDLANGNLFLVRADGQRHRVKQLRRDLGGLRLDPEYFKSLAASDAEIRAFFADAGGCRVGRPACRRRCGRPYVPVASAGRGRDTSGVRESDLLSSGKEACIRGSSGLENARRSGGCAP